MDDRPKFFDLNIPHDYKNPRATDAKMKMAIQLGYDTVAINIDIGDLAESAAAEMETPGDQKGKKKGKAKLRNKTIPPPYLVPQEVIDSASLTVRGKKFRQYSRLTMTLSDSTQLYGFMRGNHPVVSQYDIVAIRPANEQILNSLTSKTDVELITFDVTENCQWLKKSKLIQVGIGRGISYELSYSPALSDSSTRRQVFSNARELYRATKGRNVVITSGAERPIDLRAPLDTANLAVLFGMTPEEGRRCVSGNAYKVVLFSATRRTLKSCLHVRPVEDTPPNLLSQLMKIPEFASQVQQDSGGTKRRHDDEESAHDESKKQKKSK